MKIEQATKTQIVKNAVLSLFLYFLPIALMFITFLITGERPWEKKVHPKQEIKSINKTTDSNGSND